MRKLITSASAPAPRFRYTPCLRVGALGFVSGMVGLDPASGALAAGGVARRAAALPLGAAVEIEFVFHE